MPELGGILTPCCPALMQKGDRRIELASAPGCRAFRKGPSTDERADGNGAHPQRGGNLLLRDALVMQREHLTVTCMALGTVVVDFLGAARRAHRHGSGGGGLLKQLTVDHLRRGLLKTGVLPGQEALDGLAGFSGGASGRPLAPRVARLREPLRRIWQSGRG